MTQQPTPGTAAAIIRDHQCSPGCLTATGPATTCRCPCRGRSHGQLATATITTHTGGSST